MRLNLYERIIMTMLIPITVVLLGWLVAGPFGALLALLFWALHTIYMINVKKKK
jgi:hypothetical protein